MRRIICGMAIAAVAGMLFATPTMAAGREEGSQGSGTQRDTMGSDTEEEDDTLGSTGRRREGAGDTGTGDMGTGSGDTGTGDMGTGGGTGGMDSGGTGGTGSGDTGGTGR